MKVSPNDPRSVRTRRLLLEAMIRLAAERSVATLSVGEITREAGIHRSTFYLHYSGIPDLFEDCSRELFDQMRNEILALQSSEPGRSIHQIRPYVIVVFHHLEANESFYRAMLGRHGDPLFRALFQEEMSNWIVLPAVTLNACHKPTPQFEMVARFFSAGFTEIAIWWLEKNKPLTAEDAATRIVQDLLPDYLRFIQNQE